MAHPKEFDALVKSAVGDKDVPKLYASGFGVGLSNSDIFIVFQRFSDTPVAIVNLSYTLAKTLAQRLGVLVSEFEQAIGGGQEILTTDRIDEVFKRVSKEQPAEPPKDDNVH